MYPPELVKPMREELSSKGFQELHTADEVDAVMHDTQGTVLVIVNSVCGCAAGAARPGIVKAVTSSAKLLGPIWHLIRHRLLQLHSSKMATSFT